MLYINFPCRLVSRGETGVVGDSYGYIKWIDLSIVIVVMLTIALTAHGYLVRKQ